MANASNFGNRTGPPVAMRPPTLSTQERLVAQLVCRGLSNKQIAAMAGLSEHTVSSYLRRIYAKVGVNSRVSLAVSMHVALADGSEATVPEPMGL